MKPRKEISERSGIPIRLINAVCKTLSPDSESDLESTLQDVANHGADCGFHGFICYRETHLFATKYRKEIAETLHNLASSLGESEIDIVKSFRCLQGVKNDYNINRCLSIALYGGRFYKTDLDLMDVIYNAFSWFALEEVARVMVDD